MKHYQDRPLKYKPESGLETNGYSYC